VCFLHTTRGCGRIERPAFPAPSDFKGGTSRQDSREVRGETAKLWLFENLDRKHSLVVIIRQRVGAARRPMTGSSG
jgi:hypothetical protein